MNPLLIDLRQLPEEGKSLEGELPASWLELRPDDSVKASGPVIYSLRVERDGSDLLVSGRLDASFDLECGRCLGLLKRRALLPHYHAQLPVGEADTIDLTEAVREDILLTIPNFPRCEDGNIEPRSCPAFGRFDSPDPSEGSQPPPGPPSGVWDRLDQLKKP